MILAEALHYDKIPSRLWRLIQSQTFWIAVGVFLTAIGVAIALLVFLKGDVRETKPEIEGERSTTPGDTSPTPIPDKSTPAQTPSASSPESAMSMNSQKYFKKSALAVGSNPSERIAVQQLRSPPA
jgi:hypothetical protein